MKENIKYSFILKKRIVIFASPKDKLSKERLKFRIK